MDKTSTFYDFSNKRRYDWKKQAKENDNVKYYYDKEQKAWCRKVMCVKGKIRNGLFYPNENQIVNYPQIIKN